MQKLAHFVKVDWWDGSHILTSLFSPIKFTVNFQLKINDEDYILIHY